MKTSDSHPLSHASNSHSDQPFFGAQAEQAFFSKGRSPAKPFFNSSSPPSISIQAKHTVGAVGNFYELRSIQRIGKEAEEDPLRRKAIAPLPLAAMEEDDKLHNMLGEQGTTGGQELIENKQQPQPTQRTTENSTVTSQPHQSNKTGMPDALKEGIENLSGYSLDNVRVYYNSPKPAQLQALAYAQGTDIHVASGQEEHLPHEAWHVVQQAQGRVQPMLQAKGYAINDDAGLEHEAEVMGAKALQMPKLPLGTTVSPHQGDSLLQRVSETLNEDAADLGAALPNQEVVQKIKIKGEQIRPTGKNGKALWEEVCLAMFTAGLSPHGAAKVFKETVKKDPTDYYSSQAFIEVFLKSARDEIARVAGEKARGNKKVRGWARTLKINRPAWPESYKKYVKKGEDIRHIVRNATLKNAIEGERAHQAELGGEIRAMEAMSYIANVLEIREKMTHSIEVTTEIYRRAYLNLGNLFPGAGAINRVIGLTSDKITALGMQAIASKEFASVKWIEETFESVALLVSGVSDQMDRTAEKMGSSDAETFLKGFEDFFDSIIDYLIDMEDKYVEMASASLQGSEDDMEEEALDMSILIGVTEAEIGRELMDIGANFGFDIPDEALANEGMRALIMTEIALANYKPGNPDDLAQILVNFMQVKYRMKI